MRFPALLAALLWLAHALPADAQGRGRDREHNRDQDAAMQAMRDGQILPLGAIISRVRIEGGRFIGAELDIAAAVYRLKFMRGDEVIWVDFDARTGRYLGRVR